MTTLTYVSTNDQWTRPACPLASSYQFSSVQLRRSICTRLSRFQNTWRHERYCIVCPWCHWWWLVQGEIEVVDADEGASHVSIEIEKTGRSELQTDGVTVNHTLFDVGHGGSIFVLQLVRILWPFSLYLGVKIFVRVSCCSRQKQFGTGGGKNFLNYLFLYHHVSYNITQQLINKKLTH